MVEISKGIVNLHKLTNFELKNVPIEISFYVYGCDTLLVSSVKKMYVDYMTSFTMLHHRMESLDPRKYSSHTSAFTSNSKLKLVLHMIYWYYIDIVIGCDEWLGEQGLTYIWHVHMFDHYILSYTIYTFIYIGHRKIKDQITQHLSLVYVWQ